jgi:hypothetical protein
LKVFVQGFDILLSRSKALLGFFVARVEVSSPVRVGDECRPGARDVTGGP